MDLCNLIFDNIVDLANNKLERLKFWNRQIQTLSLKKSNLQCVRCRGLKLGKNQVKRSNSSNLNLFNFRLFEFIIFTSLKYLELTLKIIDFAIVYLFLKVHQFLTNITNIFSTRFLFVNIFYEVIVKLNKADCFFLYIKARHATFSTF